MLNEVIAKFGGRNCISVLMFILGVVLSIQPQGVTSVVLNIGGICVLVFGIIYCLLYFMSEAQHAMDKRYLEYGLASIVGGLVLITCKTLLISVVPLMLGLMITVGGIQRMQSALDMKRLGGEYLPSLISSGVAIVLGLLAVLNPFSSAMILMRLIGISLILESLAEIVFGIRFDRFLNGTRR